jgi:hypothetical protein
MPHAYEWQVDAIADFLQSQGSSPQQYWALRLHHVSAEINPSDGATKKETCSIMKQQIAFALMNIPMNLALGRWSRGGCRRGSILEADR